MSVPFERLSAALADRYRIERELGAGGMATVYLAQDLKHDRKVALKVLRPELAAVLGAERFVVEIKTTASLSHPHILPLFDSGTADSFLFYVMPYIEGETLRDKLTRETQLGIEEAVRITREVADALDYAHRHGVIHRDIKPENILLHDGRPMVADFGIALAVSAAAGGRMTETGLSLGTPHYMSPEQATAEKEISARSDVYSLGSVLYEMLAGQPPHLGGSAQQIIMKIVTDTARPVTEHRKSVPLNVAAALAKSLEKLPADRFESAAKFAEALGNPGFTVAGGVRGSAEVLQQHTASRRVIAALTLVSVAAVGFAAWAWLRPESAMPVSRYTLAFPPGQEPLPGGQVAAAPDGSFLLYQGLVEGVSTQQQLWIKRRDSDIATPVTGTVGARHFAISPDGRWIAFDVFGGAVKRLPIVGGSAEILVPGGSASAPGAANVARLEWLDDATVVFMSTEFGSPPRLEQVSITGNTRRVLWESDSLAPLLPSPIAGGRGVIFTACTQFCAGRSDLWVLDRKTGAASARLILPGALWGKYLKTGHLLYVRPDGALFAVRFDARRMEVTGQPVEILGGVARDIAPLFELSANGTLVMLKGKMAGQDASYEMVWVDRTGREAAVDSSWAFNPAVAGANHGWSLSPDGTRLAIALVAGGNSDIWVKALPRGPQSRISFDPGGEFRPRWSRDGRFITFISVRTTQGLYQRRADGTDTRDSLLVAGAASEGTWTPDGQLLLRMGGVAGPGGRDIRVFRPGRDSAPVPLLATPFDEHAAALSPDGRWMAYQSDETGRQEVFIRPFPETNQGKWPVSVGGGTSPLWSRDGRELFYVNARNEMVVVRVTAGASVQLGEARTLFRIRPEFMQPDLYYTPWDIAVDGRFIMARRIQSVSEEESRRIVVENFFEELKAKLK